MLAQQHTLSFVRFKNSYRYAFSHAQALSGLFRHPVSPTNTFPFCVYAHQLQEEDHDTPELAQRGGLAHLGCRLSLRFRCIPLPLQTTLGLLTPRCIFSYLPFACIRYIMEACVALFSGPRREARAVLKFSTFSSPKQPVLTVEDSLWSEDRVLCSRVVSNSTIEGCIRRDTDTSSLPGTVDVRTSFCVSTFALNPKRQMPACPTKQIAGVSHFGFTDILSLPF